MYLKFMPDFPKDRLRDLIDAAARCRRYAQSAKHPKIRRNFEILAERFEALRDELIRLRGDVSGDKPPNQ